MATIEIRRIHMTGYPEIVMAFGPMPAFVEIVPEGDDGPYYDEATEQFDVDAWESDKLFIPVSGREQFRAAHMAARTALRETGPRYSSQAVGDWLAEHLDPMPVHQFIHAAGGDQ